MKTIKFFSIAFAAGLFYACTNTAQLETNKEIARRGIIEIWNEGKAEAVDALIADNFVDHNAPPGLPPGKDGFRQLVNMYRTAFPDVSFVIDFQVAEGDKVATRYTATGTQNGELMGYPPSGKHATVRGIIISRIENGKIVESWENFEMYEMLVQIGMLPAPGSNPQAAVTRFFNEAINQAKAELLNELLSNDFISHNFPQPNSNKEAMIAGCKEILAAFSGMKVTVEDQTISGDKVYTRGYWTGRHTGVFQGMKPTNKDVKVEFQDIWRVKDGQLAENWVTMDIAGLMQQIGGMAKR
ncbi:MAG TPA: ester cyclase [Chitinophagales bacterium]|nr:ester cyclase [Chitinophagales bacterium]